MEESLEKYTSELESKKISYNACKCTEKLEIVKKYKGEKDRNNIKYEKKDCEKCKLDKIEVAKSNLIEIDCILGELV